MNDPGTWAGITTERCEDCGHPLDTDCGCTCCAGGTDDI